MMKLSIIVPVYNSKEYLHQCVKSIINQTYSDIEVILVNDGSTDGSDKICDLYQDIDERVHVIHQENRGCVSARKCGLQKSKGEYIGFVDSDDWVAPDMYEELISIAEKKMCDIVSMGYSTVYGENITKEEDATLYGFYRRHENLNIFLSNMIYDAVEKRRGANPSLCCKIIKRELLVKAYSDIDERITLGEDAAIFYPCCLESDSIFVVKEYKYYYRIRSESMCRNVNIDTISKIYIFYEFMKIALGRYNKEYELLKQLKRYLWTFLEISLNQVFNIRTGVTYMFPYALVKQNSDIILYGAGEVGQAYYEQISINHYCNIVAWADKGKCGRKNIISPKQITNLNYSGIVIAIKNKKMVDEVIEELIQMEINENKILWSYPQEIEHTVI